MPLFVVACGVLLMLGGAISLLLGFDIVLTERGAAMTIGGVVALAGGVIAVGLGFALKRLNQILGALEARAGRPVRSAGPDRPVLPVAGDDQPPPPPLPVVPDVVPAPPAVSSPSAGSLLPAATVVAGAAAIGAAAAFSRSEHEDAPAAHADALEPPPSASGWVPEGPSVPSPPPLPDIPETSPGVAAPIAVPLDLEEELSRALAETTVPSLQEPSAEDVVEAFDSVPDPKPLTQEPAAEDDRSFEDGLSQLLGRSVRPASSPTISEPTPKQDLEELISGLRRPPIEPDRDAFSPATGEPDPLPEPDIAETTPHLSDAAEEGLDAATHQADEPAMGTADPDADLFEEVEDAEAVAAEELPRQASLEPPASDPASGPSPEPPVLGTYTIAGRTYRMFADGSVEAVSEGGEVERFSSMDELRKHLARG